MKEGWEIRKLGEVCGAGLGFVGRAGLSELSGLAASAKQTMQNIKYKFTKEGV